MSQSEPVVRKIRVLLVDDNASYRERMARLLQTQADLEVIGQAAEGKEALARARALQPDVILMDFRMTGLDGYTAARAIVQNREASFRAIDIRQARWIGRRSPGVDWRASWSKTSLRRRLSRQYAVQLESWRVEELERGLLHPRHA